MINSTKKISSKTGLPPGALVHVGEPMVSKVVVTQFDYNKGNYEESTIDDLEKCNHCKKEDTVTWLNISGLHETELMKKISEYFDLHSLVMEDIMNTKHRPKAEEYDNYLFFTLKMLDYNEEQRTVDSEQVSFILGGSYIISFQEKEGDVFEPIRTRIRQAKGKIREKKTDYLAYLLIDIIIDHYFFIIENLGQHVDDIEEQVLENPTKDLLSQTQYLKNQIIAVRKAIYPLREAISFITKGETKFVDDNTVKYYRDAYDHTVSVVESIETYRDRLSTIKDIYLSSMGHKMNNIMSVLTIMASIFIPLTFVVGIYGMNFKHMPELEYRYGYPGVWILMVIITLGMVLYFKKKKWI